MKTSEPGITAINIDVLYHVAEAIEYLERSFLCKNYKILKLAGIEFHINITTFALPVILVASCGLDWSVALCMAWLILSILLHEMAHALGGYLVGNPARKICLFCLGGFTLFRKMLGATARDALTSFLGPLANALIVLATVGIETWIYGLSFWKWLQILFIQAFGEYPSIRFMPESFFLLNSLAMMNLFMMIFNMLPAYPLDGGRILRWVCGSLMPSVPAAITTMIISRVLACLIIIYGVVTHLINDFCLMDFFVLLFVAAVTWLGSGLEVWRTADEDTTASIETETNDNA